MSRKDMLARKARRAFARFSLPAKAFSTIIENEPSLEALGLFVKMGTYSSFYECEGFVPLPVAQNVSPLPRLFAELISAGLIASVSDGFQILNWNRYGKTRAQLAAKTAKASARSKATSTKTRQAVIERHGMTCWLCQLPISSLNELHVDHVVPLLAGGDSDLDNLKPAHARCNLIKGARGEWIARAVLRDRGIC